MRGYVLQDTTQKYLCFKSKHGHNAMVVVDKNLRTRISSSCFFLFYYFRDSALAQPTRTSPVYCPALCRAQGCNSNTRSPLIDVVQSHTVTAEPDGDSRAPFEIQRAAACIRSLSLHVLSLSLCTCALNKERARMHLQAFEAGAN